MDIENAYEEITSECCFVVHYTSYDDYKTDYLTVTGHEHEEVKCFYKNFLE